MDRIAPVVGQVLGHYRIVEKLGAGGMGVVYRAHDERLGRDVALKVLPQELVSDAAARERLLGEAQTVSALNHPHICTVHEVGEAMSCIRLAKAVRFLLIITALPMCILHAQSTRNTQAAPSLQEFFQALVQHYDPSSLPRYEDVLKVIDQIPSASSEDVSKALPAIFVALMHPDDNVKIDAAFALSIIGRRPDSAELLKDHIITIGNLFDLSDPRLQATPTLVFLNLKPKPPPEVVPLLLTFLKRTDRDQKAQGSAVLTLVRLAPEKPEVISAIREFLSRPLETSTRVGVLNGLGDPRVKDPQIIDMVSASLDDPDLGVRFTAIQVLTRMGPSALQQAEPTLKKTVGGMLKFLRQTDGDMSMQVYAVSVLVQYAPEKPEIAAAIREFLSRPLESAPRIGILNALGTPRVKDPQIIKMVIGSLDDPDQGVRFTAIQVLTRMGPHALLLAQPALHRLADDPKQPAEVKAAAKQALEELHRRN
jgi:HEAT repeat protein